MIARSPTNLRPGLLVNLSTSIKGNVQYQKQTIESDHEDVDGARVASWETKRRIADPAEHEKATEVRSKARSIISRVCAVSAFGLLCPEEKAAELDAAFDEADALVAEFNKSARLSRIELNAITGKIAPDDERAMRAINAEVRGLMEQMESGIQRLDVASVRDAANRARSVGQMLSPEAYKRVSEAIEIARSTARKIVKAGEVAAQEIDTQAMAAIARQRHAFLDLDDAAEVAAPVEQGRAVEFEPEAPVVREPGSYQASAPQIEL